MPITHKNSAASSSGIEANSASVFAESAIIGGRG